MPWIALQVVLLGQSLVVLCGSIFQAAQLVGQVGIHCMAVFPDGHQFGGRTVFGDVGKVLTRTALGTANGTLLILLVNRSCLALLLVRIREHRHFILLHASSFTVLLVLPTGTYM